MNSQHFEQQNSMVQAVKADEPNEETIEEPLKDLETLDKTYYKSKFV